jgi:hypothetical protein
VRTIEQYTVVITDQQFAGYKVSVNVRGILVEL